MVNISNSVVLVTGANGGLGQDFVVQAMQRGASTVYAGARQPQQWDDPRIVPLALDVTDPESVAAAAAAAAAAAPDVTIVINNAGIMRTGSLAYGASKAALWSATNALRLELAKDDVHVTRTILDGLEADEDAVLADETTRQVRAGLAAPIATLVAAVAGARACLQNMLRATRGSWKRLAIS